MIGYRVFLTAQVTRLADGAPVARWTRRAGRLAGRTPAAVAQALVRRLPAFARPLPAALVAGAPWTGVVAPPATWVVAADVLAHGPWPALRPVPPATARALRAALLAGAPAPRAE